MTWPADGEPRYVVAFDEPTPMGKGAGYVYDRAYCHEQVFRVLLGFNARRRVQAVCDRMNADAEASRTRQRMRGALTSEGA